MATNDYRAFDFLLEGVQVISPDYRYLYVNQALLDHAKSTKEKLIGHTMMEQYPGIEKTEMFSHLNQCLIKGQSHKMDNIFTYPNGETRHFELRMQPVPDGILIMSLDITDRKKIENELNRMNNLLDEMVNERTTELLKMLEKEKRVNEIKSKFFSLISHELKTPLVAIKVTVNALMDLGKSGDLQLVKRHLKNINTSINDMFELIDDFLSQDKIDLEKLFFDPQKFNLMGLVKQEVATLQGLCKVNQVIDIDYNGKNEVNQDSKIIKSMLINLLSNAIKYSDENIELVVDVQDDLIQLDVIDQGIGIPEEDQGKLFDQYFRASNASDIHGTGMGLNIVKQYVQSLNGSISFHSEFEKGSHFTIAIPNFEYSSLIQ